MVATFEEVDVSRALEHAGYTIKSSHGVGDYDIIFWAEGEPDRSGWHTGHLSMDEIGWYHADPKPTEQQMIGWENERLALLQQEDDDRQTVINETNSYLLGRSDYVLAYQLQAKLTQAYANGLNPSLSTVYQNFVQTLNGTSLETPITNFVTMMTGITEFGLTISDTDKRAVLENAIDFLQSLCVVGLVKGLV